MSQPRYTAKEIAGIKKAKSLSKEDREVYLETLASTTGRTYSGVTNKYFRLAGTHTPSKRRNVKKITPTDGATGHTIEMPFTGIEVDMTRKILRIVLK